MSGEDFHLTVVCAHRRTSLRSPNARNKFAFALGERKLLATLKFLYVKLGGHEPQLMLFLGNNKFISIKKHNIESFGHYFTIIA